MTPWRGLTNLKAKAFSRNEGTSMATVQIGFLHRQLEERKRRLETVIALSPNAAGVEALLREVDSALDRFAAGTYGLCEIGRASCRERV